MAQLTYNTVIYNNINKWTENGGEITYNGILIASKLNQKNGQDYKLLDAIDIDWNGAWISSLKTNLYTTEDLVRVLNELNKSDDVEELDKNIELIWKQIEEITSTYITYTSLYNILSTSYQYKLVDSEYIKVDPETNVISAYNLASYSYVESYYTSKAELNIIYNYLHDNYWKIPETQEYVKDSVKEAIDKVIDGADQAFDTLKEISDWILDQNRYVPVSPQEVFLALSDPNNEDQYFWFDEETGKYIEITNPDEVVMDGSVQYFRLENYLTDIKKLIDEVDELQETVGTSYLSYYFDYDTNSYVFLEGAYTYTGILKDIDDLHKKDIELMSIVNDINVKADIAIEKSEEALDTANTAYSTANIAYETANTAYEIAVETSELAEVAYKVAIKASEDVGIPTKVGLGFVKIEFADIYSYIEAGEQIYYYELGEYIEAQEPYTEDYNYYIYDEHIEGTGLTKRVEDVEAEVDDLTLYVNDVKELADTALYRLKVDNSESSYVKLSLKPEFYDGDNTRTIHIETKEAIVNPETGEVSNPGVATVSTIYDVYAYASSWQILDNSYFGQPEELL